MYGDVVVMENYGRITERTLRKMLEMRGVTLLFQSAHSPHLNTCKYCFHEVKQQLRRDEHRNGNKERCQQ